MLVTKIDNTYASSPQLGLGEADLVVEELVEGGLTRLAAFFYSAAAEQGRPGPLDAGQRHRHRLAGRRLGRDQRRGRARRSPGSSGAGIQFFQEGAPGLSRDTSRSAPYNVFADLPTVAKDGRDGRDPSRRLPAVGRREGLPGRPAGHARSRRSFGGGHTTNWTYDGKGYVNENTYAADGDEFPADTVLVLRVQVGDAGYLDPAGNPVPETKLTARARR